VNYSGFCWLGIDKASDEKDTFVKNMDVACAEFAALLKYCRKFADEFALPCSNPSASASG
jgi:hypothetical protein